MSDEKNDEQFELTLKGDGVEIKRAVDQRQLAAIMHVLMETAAHIGIDSNISAELHKETPAKVSLREYLDEVHASRKLEQIVAIGHYMMLHEDQQTFSRDDIKARFSAAREPLPSNFPRDFNVAIKHGMIAEDHKRSGHYYVTKTGIQAVNRKFLADSKK